MRIHLPILVAALMLAGCASQPREPLLRDAAGGQLAQVDMAVCSQVAADPERKLSKKERLAELRMALGAGYMRKGALDVALQELEKSLELNPRSAEAHATMALLMLSLDKPVQAGEHYARALQLAPSDPEIRNNYGVYLCNQGRAREADAQFRCAIANPLYRTPAMAYTNAAECALRHGDPSRAEVDLQTAAQLDPSYAAASLLLADLSMDRGDAGVARRHLNRYMRHAGQTPAGLALGIRVETALGDLDRAASYRLLLKNRFPDSREAQELN
nr:TPR repeat protein [uncultured bacterium]BAH90126.1 TPR repeat protein [uncultured bacterium]BAH90526.1 TPR repeat protein [uncultured bacterium]